MSPSAFTSRTGQVILSVFSRSVSRTLTSILHIPAPIPSYKNGSVTPFVSYSSENFRFLVAAGNEHSKRDGDRKNTTNCFYQIHYKTSD